MVLLLDPATDRLVTMASRGYGTSGVGAEVERGQGLIGTATNELRVIRLTGLEANLRYSRAVRHESGSARPEVPSPGLADAQSAMVIPFKLYERLSPFAPSTTAPPLASTNGTRPTSRSSAIRSPSASTARPRRARGPPTRREWMGGDGGEVGARLRPLSRAPEARRLQRGDVGQPRAGADHLLNDSTTSRRIRLVIAARSAPFEGGGK